jgi:hypothetical protein
VAAPTVAMTTATTPTATGPSAGPRLVRSTIPPEPSRRHGPAPGVARRDGPRATTECHTGRDGGRWTVPTSAEPRGGLRIG